MNIDTDTEIWNKFQVSEEKAHQREDIIKDQIRHLVLRLKVSFKHRNVEGVTIAMVRMQKAVLSMER